MADTSAEELALDLAYLQSLSFEERFRRFIEWSTLLCTLSNAHDTHRETPQIVKRR